MNKTVNLLKWLVKSSLELTFTYFIVIYVLYEKLQWINWSTVKVLFIFTLAGILLDACFELSTHSKEVDLKKWYFRGAIAVITIHLILFFALTTIVSETRAWLYTCLSFIVVLGTVVGIFVLIVKKLNSLPSSPKETEYEQRFTQLGVPFTDIPKYQANRVYKSEQLALFEVIVHAKVDEIQAKQALADCLIKFQPLHDNLIVKIADKAGATYVGGYLSYPCNLSPVESWGIQIPSLEQNTLLLFFDNHVIHTK